MWVVHPEAQEIHQYRRDAPEVVRVYRSGDTIDMNHLVPGLIVTVADCFLIDLSDEYDNEAG